MKYFAILALAIGALASPQAATITSAPAAASTSAVGLSSALQCVQSCKAGDVDCQAACLGNARPNASQAIDTNKCAAKCDQGDGSAAAATAYSNCVQGCIASLFPSSQTAFGAGGAGASAASRGASATTGSARASGGKFFISASKFLYPNITYSIWLCQRIRCKPPANWSCGLEVCSFCRSWSVRASCRLRFVDLSVGTCPIDVHLHLGKFLFEQETMPCGGWIRKTYQHGAISTAGTPHLVIRR